MNEQLNKYIYKRRLGLGELLLMTIWLLMIGAIAYRVHWQQNDDWFRYFTAFIFGLLFLSYSVKTFLQRAFARIEVNAEGIEFHVAVFSFFSWLIRWGELDEVHVNRKWYNNILTIVPKAGFSVTDNKVVEVKYWHQINGAKNNRMPIFQAVEKFKTLKHSTTALPIKHPYEQDLGKAAEKVTAVIFTLVVVCLMAGFYIHRYVTVSNGIPLWAMVLGGAGTALAVVLYMVKAKANAVAIPVIGLFSAAAGAFIVSVIIKSSVVFFGNDQRVDFILLEKNDGFQLWQAVDTPSMSLKLSYKNAKPIAGSKQGDRKQLTVRSGMLSLDLLLPNEIDKIRTAAE